MGLHRPILGSLLEMQVLGPSAPPQISWIRNSGGEASDLLTSPPADFAHAKVWELLLGWVGITKETLIYPVGILFKSWVGTGDVKANKMSSQHSGGCSDLDTDHYSVCDPTVREARSGTGRAQGSWTRLFPTCLLVVEGKTRLLLPGSQECRGLRSLLPPRQSCPDSRASFPQQAVLQKHKDSL